MKNIKKTNQMTLTSDVSRKEKANYAQRIKIALIALVMLLNGADMAAQVKGVWGDANKAKPQKTGQTYLGVMYGKNCGPSGLSALVHLNERSALHAFYGVDFNQAPEDQKPLYGISYQPRINFRNRNLNAAYYMSFTVIHGGSREKLVEADYKYPRLAQTQTVRIKTETKIGVGMFFEVFKKYQIFAETNYDVYFRKDYVSCMGFQNAIGVRAFIF